MERERCTLAIGRGPTCLAGVLAQRQDRTGPLGVGLNSTFELRVDLVGMSVGVPIGHVLVD